MDNKEKKMNIETLPLFEGIDADVVRQISQASSARIFNKGDTIFEKGNPARFLYILEQGEIELVDKSRDGNSINLTDPGAVFGWSSLAESGVYTSTAVCRSETSAQCIAKSDIEPVLNQNPKAAVALYQRLGELLTKRMPKVVE